MSFQAVFAPAYIRERRRILVIDHLIPETGTPVPIFIPLAHRIRSELEQFVVVRQRNDCLLQFLYLE